MSWKKPRLHWYWKSRRVGTQQYQVLKWEPVPVCGITLDYVPMFAREKKQVTCKNCKKKLRVLTGD